MSHESSHVTFDLLLTIEFPVFSWTTLYFSAVWVEGRIPRGIACKPLVVQSGHPKHAFQGGMVTETILFVSIMVKLCHNREGKCQGSSQRGTMLKFTSPGQTKSVMLECWGHFCICLVCGTCFQFSPGILRQHQSLKYNKR